MKFTYGSQHERHRTNFGVARIAVLKHKRILVLFLVRYGSRSNTKNWTVIIKVSVRFTLLTIILKNGTVTVAITVKNGTVKKTENGTVQIKI